MKGRGRGISLTNGEAGGGRCLSVDVTVTAKIIKSLRETGQVEREELATPPSTNPFFSLFFVYNFFANGNIFSRGKFRLVDAAQWETKKFSSVFGSVECRRRERERERARLGASNETEIEMRRIN